MSYLIGTMDTMPKLIFFDLDGTLSVSKRPLTDGMAGLVAQLLERTRVAVISGGALPQFLEQVVSRLPAGTNVSNLYLLPTSGAALYEYQAGAWQRVYEELIPETDAAKIVLAAQGGAEATGLIDFGAPAQGERIEYRGSQVTLSALGQQASAEEKALWDPDKSKRLAIREEIQHRLPEGYSAAMGGLTSIDITKNGVDKAYGIRQLCAHLNIPESDVLYVGDQLVPGGNDEAALNTGAATKSVSSPADTAHVMSSLLGE